MIKDSQTESFYSHFLVPLLTFCSQVSGDMKGQKEEGVRKEKTLSRHLKFFNG